MAGESLKLCREMKILIPDERKQAFQTLINLDLLKNTKLPIHDNINFNCYDFATRN